MGKIFVVSGPSGAGKDAVITKLAQNNLRFYTIKTTTTRAMREGEGEGKPYYFISKKEFKKKIAVGEMVEWAIVYNNYYGSSKEEIDRALRENEIVIWKVDPQGARKIKELMPEVVTIFVIPPSFEMLEDRLRGRGQDSDEVINRRLKAARRELAHLLDWDYVVLNEEDLLDETAEKVLDIIRVN